MQREGITLRMLLEHTEFNICLSDSKYLAVVVCRMQ